MPLLNIEDLVVSYGAIRALHGISFHVDEGEVVTLIGANGAGKSTTLRAISGLLPPDRGRIMYDGTDLTQVGADMIVRMGIVQVPEGRKIFALRSNLQKQSKDRLFHLVVHVVPRCPEHLLSFP